MTIEEQTASSPDQLYNYLLAHERRYEMRVLRMMPLFEDVGGQTVRPGGRSDGAGQGTADTGPAVAAPGWLWLEITTFRVPAILRHHGCCDWFCNR